VTLRAAVLGVGSWAQTAHLPALVAHPEVEVVACADADLAQARAVAETFGVVSAYDGLRSLLENENSLDLLVIVAPDDVHPVAIRAALDRGIAVFCEKPLANDFASAADLSDRASAASVVSTVGYSFRYSPAVQALRTDLIAGRLGTPWLIEVAEHNAQFHPLLGKPLNWKGHPDHAAAGALFEYGSHVLDLSLWLLGPVTDVSAHLITVLPEAKLDDIATLQLRFASGAAGTLVSSWLLTGGFPGIRIRLHGSLGLSEVELNDTIPGGERYSHYELDGRIRETVSTPPLEHGPSSYARLHLADVVSSMTGSPLTISESLPTIEQAAETQRVLDRALAATAVWAPVDASNTLTR
jgi:predicted dehydrogenase